MKATRETSKIYAGRERIVYRLSEPLDDRTYPFIDSLTGVLRFRQPDLVMVWGDNGEHLSVADLNCQVTDYHPIVKEAEIRQAIIAAEAAR